MVIPRIQFPWFQGFLGHGNYNLPRGTYHDLTNGNNSRAEWRGRFLNGGGSLKILSAMECMRLNSKQLQDFYDDVATLSAHTHIYTCIQYTLNLCIHIGVHTCIDHTCYMRMHIQIYTMTFMQKKHIYYIYIYICREYASGLLMFTSWFDGFHCLLFVCFTGCPTGPGVSKSPLSRMASPVSTGGC